MTSTSDTAAAAPLLPRKHVPLRTVIRNPLLLAALVVAVGITLAVVAAPVLAPYPPLQQNLRDALQLPSPQHLLGTDTLGRDILSRMLWGGQPALFGVAVATITFAVLGSALGVLAGYLGGWVDRVVVAVLDVMMSVPAIILVLAVLAIFDQSIFASMFVLGVFASASLARLVRSSCIALRGELFVDAARVSGISPLRIMARHVLPALTGQILIQMALISAGALGVQTGLGFLGLGTQPPAPSWGGMVGEAAGVMQTFPWLLLVSGGIIAVMALSFGLIGDGIRDLEAGRRRRSGRWSRRRNSPVDSSRPIDSTRPAAGAGSEQPAGGEAALLVVEDYSVAFATPDGPMTVVDGINLSVSAGEIFGIVGESGSGKTVTALSLLGLLPENGRVTGGAAWLDGTRISGIGPRELRRIRGREIGLISQEPMVALDPLFTIGSQLGEVIRSIGDVEGGRTAVRRRAIELLAQARLPEPEALLARYPFELSGGMLQRVVIAMSLAGSPKLLIADEPTTALDVTVQASILDLLRAICRDRGMAIILVTHDLGVVADACDRAVVMQNGRVVESGPIEQIFYAPQNDYTTRLIASTPSIVRRTDV